MLNFNKDFLMGFISGTVVGAAGYRLYEQNSGQLQRLIQPSSSVKVSPVKISPNNAAEPTVEELVAQKEGLEDEIAEKQMK